MRQSAKFLAALAAFAILISNFPNAAVHAATGDFQIDGSGVLVKYSGSGGDVTVPDGVTEIGEEAFGSCTALQTVSLPAGLKKIGQFAFTNCGNLKAVDLPDSVTVVGQMAFQNCAGLTGVHLPSGLTALGTNLFFGCNALKTVSVPDGVKRIESGALNCVLTSAVIPASVDFIDANAFNASAPWPETLPKLYEYDGTAAQRFAAQYNYPSHPSGSIRAGPTILETGAPNKHTW